MAKENGKRESMRNQGCQMKNVEYYPFVILGAGDYPSHQIPLGVLRSAQHVVCCDGAAMEYIQKEGKAPWRIVGDGDSLIGDYWDDYAEIIRRFSEQDYNDQSKATYYLRDHGVSKIAYVGATGKREDHTLGNISLLIEYLHWGQEVAMFTDHGMFIPCHDRFSSAGLTSCGSKVSIFNFGSIGMKSYGLKYPLYDLQSWWQGTLNEVCEDEFTVEAQGDFLVYIAY